MFRQDRTNPSTAVSNWRGRHDASKAWPSTAVSSWLNGGLFGASFTPITATGGTISDYTNDTDGFTYRSHTFNSSGTFTITANPDGHVFDVLVVGSGAGSGAGFRNGGGGGEALSTLGQTGNVESYTITIGAGGSPVGNASVFVSAPATTPALTGRCGIYSQPYPYGAGASGNGNAGGANSGGGGAGGGGAGGAGTNSSTNVGTNGGAGLNNTPFQAGIGTYGGGGGGGSNNGSVSGTFGWGGNPGGGGNGGTMGWYNSGIPISTVGAVNTGGGGGGNGDNGGGQPQFTCAGGSGKVIVRYALEATS